MKRHPLRQHQPKRMKDMNNLMGSASAWQYGSVVEHINVAIPTNHLLYTFYDLHRIPHGDENLSNKDALDKSFQGMGIRVINICGTMSYGPLAVYYHDSPFMRDMYEHVNVKRMQRELFHYLLQMYNSNGGKHSRDSYGVRVDFGLGQGQLSSNLFTDKAGNAHRIPFCNLKELHKMNHNLKSDIIDLLMYMQTLLPHACPDKERSNFVHSSFHSAGLEGSQIDWEYVNISLRRSDDTLHMHLDHKNDARLGYNHGAVYSYLSADQGHDYRVVIVMTFRASMGSFMERIRQA